MSSSTIDARVDRRPRSAANIRTIQPTWATVTYGVGQAGLAALGILRAGAQPLATMAIRIITYPATMTRCRLVAVVDGREQRGQPERDDQHADHLHHRHQPEDPVVGVVGGGEPGEVDPRPDDREHREAEADEARRDVAAGEHVRELRRRPRRTRRRRSGRTAVRAASRRARSRAGRARPCGSPGGPAGSSLRQRRPSGPRQRLDRVRDVLRAIFRSPRSTRILCASKSTSAWVAPAGGSKR